MHKQWKRKGTRKLVASVLLAAAGVVMAPSIQAAGPPNVADLPTAAPVPAGKGVPYATNPPLETQKLKANLAAVGYVEEEFVVSGGANVYVYGQNGAPEVKTPEMPYATRILVRRPKDMQRFSGRVFVEGGPGTDGLPWAADFVTKNGDAWVSINTHGLRQSVETLQKFDPVRYAALTYPEFGQNWDIMGEVGRLLKSDAPHNPLKGRVNRLYGHGWSGTGSIWWFYINERFHRNVRLPGGKPIYDGYMVGEPSGYSPINGLGGAAARLSPGDPRHTVVLPRDVPAIVLHSRPQQQERRRSDGNSPNDRYRVYEIAGATHANIRYSRIYPQVASAFQVGGPFGCAQPISRFPFHYFYQSTLARLVAWAERGVVPPPSQRLELNADGTVKADPYGNDLGGVRSPYVDVPAFAYVPNKAGPNGQPLCNGADALGAEIALPKDRLIGLYRNRDGYVSKVVQRTGELQRQGWLLPDDAAQIRRDAAQYGGL